MRTSGGTIYSICRECFLLWDGDCSGELNVREFTGAIKKMGLDITDVDAKQIVAYYDLEGDGEMKYQELVKDIVAGVPHFMHHPKTPGRVEKENSNSSNLSEKNSGSNSNSKSNKNTRSDPPKAVLRIQGKIREACNLAATKSASRISGEDLFYGTCIRFDRSNTGRLSQGELEKVFKEMKVRLGEVELRHLVGWWDIGAEGIVQYKEVVRSVFGGMNDSSREKVLNTARQLTARSNKGGGGGSARGGMKSETGSGMDFKNSELTARAKRAGVLAEKAQIERRIKDLMRKEKMLSQKL